MRIVSPLLKRVVYPALSAIGAFRRISGSGLAVVTYHGIIPSGYKPVDASFDGNLIGAEMLRRQIRLLKSEYTIVPPEDVLEFLAHGQRLPSRAVLLTCDDGLLNCLTDMLPVLSEENVKCLFFVTGASAGEMRSMLWYEELFLIFLRAPSGPFKVSCRGFLMEERLEDREQRRAVWWKCVRRLSQLDCNGRAGVVEELSDQFGLGETPMVDLGDSAACRRYGLMTRNELRKLQSAGMTIGAHTLTHPILSRQEPELAYDEISQSRAILGLALGTEVWAFAYPFGDPQSITPRVLGMAEKAGYTAAFLNFGGGLGRKLPAFALPRIHMTSGMSIGEFEAQVCGFYARMQGFRSGSGATESLGGESQ
jgi:peptidoglycan/xylan/chitin deacetylase (PgdA/CDA1 family)